MLTLSMIVKNEEKYLEGCLKSVQGIVDEILVVDTGSTDKTIEIAAKYNAKIFHYDWVNNFSDARNFALKKSSGDWILYLDADERLNEGSREKIRELLSKAKSKTAYSCIVNSIDEAGNRPSKMNYVRLFPKKPGIKFEGAAHEQIIISLLKNGFEIIKTDIEIIHLGYNISKEEIKKKAERNLILLLEDYKTKKQSYTAFQIAQSFALLDKEPDAVEYFVLSLKDEKLVKESKAVAYRYIAAYEAKKLNWQEAFYNIKLSLNEDGSQPLSYLVAAQIFYRIKNFAEADNYCRKALEINHKCISSSYGSDYVIMCDEKSILFLGLGISLNGKLKNSFNFYYHKLFNEEKKYESYSEVNFFYKLINNLEIPVNNIKDYTNSMIKDNLDLTIMLLQDYKFNNIKLKIIESLLEKFTGNSSLLNFFANENIILGNFKLAEEMFNKSMLKAPDNPSAYFLLTSFYIQTSRLKDALETIETARRNFSGNVEITNRAEIVREKILAFLD